MSSKTDFTRNLLAWLYVAVSVLLFLWYANPQILYSLVFPFELLEWLFPGIASTLRSMLIG